MIKITAIAPYKEFADFFVEIFEEHNQHPYKPEYEKNEEYELEIIPGSQSLNLENVEFTSDVVIARGINVYQLRNNKDFIPVVEIPVAGNDLIRALYECKQQFGCTDVVVIGPTNMVIGAERLSPIIGMNVAVFLIHNDNQSKRSVLAVWTRRSEPGILAW